MNIKSGNATIKVFAHFSPHCEDVLDHLSMIGFSGCTIEDALDIFSSVHAECGSSQAKWAAKFAQSAECFTGLESSIPSTLTRPSSTKPTTPGAATLHAHGFDHSDIATLSEADLQECLRAIPFDEQPIRDRLTSVPTTIGAAQLLSIAEAYSSAKAVRKAREEQEFANNLKDLISAIESTMPVENS